MERIETQQFNMKNKRNVVLRRNYIELHDNYFSFVQDFSAESQIDYEDEYSPWVEKRHYQMGTMKKSTITDVYYYYDGDEFSPEDKKHTNFCLIVYSGDTSKFYFKKQSDVATAYEKIVNWWLS